MKQTVQCLGVTLFCQKFLFLSRPSTVEGVEILIFHRIFLASWEKQLQGIIDEGKKEFFDFGMFQTHHKFVKGWRGPLYRSKKSFSVYRVHGIQNDRLELTASTQQLVLQNMHRVLSYWSICPKIRRFGLASKIWTRFDQYLGIRYFPKPISALKP